MGVVISGGQSRVDPVQTFKLLDQIITTLGSTKTTLFPFFEATDDLVRSYKENYHTLVPTSNGPGFDPFKHPGGLNSYLFDPNYSMYLKGEDHGDYTFKTSGQNEDDPFSVGMWILPYDITAVTLIAKYDTNSKREWRLYINGSNKLVFDLYDEDGDRTEIGTSTTSVTANQWTFVVHTYDGTETAPVVAFYQNATADATTSTSETNSYVNMEDLTAPLTIGADLATDVPAQPFNGRIALPFVAGKKLSAAEVTTLYGIGRTLIGV